MEAMSGLPTTHSFAFYPGEDELIQFEEGFYNTDLPNLEISKLVSDDSSSNSSSSSSHVSSSTGNIPRSFDQTISRVDTNPDSTTLEAGDYSTFQSCVMSFARTTNTKTAELLMNSWEPSTHKTLVLCKMFGLARSSDLVKLSFKGLIITPDSIKGPVINAKEQKSGVISILELTSLDDTNSQVCPNEGGPLQVNNINSIVLSTLSKSGIDIAKFKSHSTRSAMASLLLSNNVPFHVVKKMGRWKSNDTVDTFYDKRIIGEKSGGFLNTVVQIS
ncbi:hypothetical protein ACTFIT_009750 [Dictyostelium discoideum]